MALQPEQLARHPFRRQLRSRQCLNLIHFLRSADIHPDQTIPHRSPVEHAQDHTATGRRRTDANNPVLGYACLRHAFGQACLKGVPPILRGLLRPSGM
ncbi:hypothetical protein D3C73_1393510 [compost metagenome]